MFKEPNLDAIEKRIVTLQQQEGFEAYKKEVDEADGIYEVIPFEQFYVYWQHENGLFDDSYLLSE